VWGIRYATRSSLRLAQIMYAQPGPCLQRKRRRFEEWVS
jgi:hypothetical protein